MANWYYEHNGKPIGPLDERTMRAWIAGGSIAPSQRIRPEGATDWQRADACFADDIPRSLAPDLLAEIGTPYFESDGLCFFPVIQAANGVCQVSLFYQNRYSARCHATVTLKPAHVAWCRTAAKPLTFQISAANGEFGVIRQAWGIHRAWQGYQAQVNVLGKTAFPEGKGTLLRLEKGINAERLSAGDAILEKFFSSLFHVNLGNDVACIRADFPSGVSEVVAEATQPESAVLWTMDPALLSPP